MDSWSRFHVQDELNRHLASLFEPRDQWVPRGGATLRAALGVVAPRCPAGRIADQPEPV